MKKNYLYLAALAMFTAACSNEDEFAQGSIKPTPEVKMITETIKASNGDNTPATRADINADADFAWSEGDQIAVHVSDGKYYTTAELTAGGAVANFTVEYPEGQTRDAFAVYPASIVTANAAYYGQSEATLDVTLPASYTLAQVSGTKTPCPMISTNTPGGSWDFFQLCGLLRLTVNNIPSTTKRLEIDFGGKKVCGNFSIAAGITPGTSVITTTADADHDCIAITKDGTDAVFGSESLVLNIPLPTGTYGDVFVIAYDALSGGNPTKFDVVSFSKEVARAGGKKFTAAMEYTANDLSVESFYNPNPNVAYAYIYQSNASTATGNTVTIANNQKVILCGVNINAVNTNAINCLGNAEIVLSGSNTVKSMSESGPLNKAVIKAGTYGSSTLTISGDGSLNASSASTTQCAVIGADYQGDCGNIVINSGTITVTSNNYGAAIGSGRVDGTASKCGTITITGGTVNATSDAGAAIGSGGRYSGTGVTSCDGITISGGTVTARSKGGAAIGSGKVGSNSTDNTLSYCGDIFITGGTIDAQTTETTDLAGAAIGSGFCSKAGNITISGGDITASGCRHSAGIGAGGHHGQCGNILINGGSVNATGGYKTYEGAGIGTGKGSNNSNSKSICGTITITNGVTIVKAKNVYGSALRMSIGKGSSSNTQCGSVTIGGTTYSNGISGASQYIYQPGAGS